MAISVKNFLGQNQNLRPLEQKGPFTVFEHIRDMSVSPFEATTKYFMSQMNCCQRQVLIQLNDNAIKLKPGEMQFMSGMIEQTSGVTGAGDFIGKLVKSKMTGDNAVKPIYKGTGLIVTEPSYQYMLIENLDDWGGQMVCDDGMFIACENKIDDGVVMRNNLSSLAGGEGLFNLCLKGSGYAVVKSPCPRTELYEIFLQNDCIKIDGNNAICWSNSLQFTCEQSGKTLLGSMASGEGLVNVYRGTGRILMTPLATGGLTASGSRMTPQQKKEASSAVTRGVMGAIMNNL